jgi:hypothetical protein
MRPSVIAFFCCWLLSAPLFGQHSKPWVFWYWMQAAVSEEGIRADLQAMKDAGIGGAYLMPIKDVANPPLYTPAARQLSPEWWKLVKFALTEADRLDLKIGMHISDGFALAGGPWISPELSMQKVVWSQINITAKRNVPVMLPQPAARENYYRDIAVYAFPSPEGTGEDTRSVIPEITTSTGTDASFLVKPGTKESFRSDGP